MCPSVTTACLNRYLQVKPWLWWFSNAVVLGGSLMYARVRQLEMASQHRTESKVEEKETTEPLQKVFTMQTLQWDQQRVCTL